ncbi:lipid II flippase family protein [Telluribacter sp.]|jgi:hypothetical protein|uniref:lipid II flippase family protein n=1 Tax=Telluribacter sp. TaxID=1978767 RepID=UPI002E1534CC|nr:DUF2837 family protein [Telluribacter sp.]
MSTQLATVLALTFVIHLIATFSLSVRVVGLRTQRFAVSFSIFNIMMLVSRISNSLQAPLLAKGIETNIQLGIKADTASFHWIIGSAMLATLLGGLGLPTFQRLLGIAVDNYYKYQSMPVLIFKTFSFTTVRDVRDNLKLPDWHYLDYLPEFRDFPKSVFILNILANAILTLGVLSSMYACYLNPDLRATSSTLAGVINGIAVVLTLVFIEPRISLLCDEVVGKRYSEARYRRYLMFIWMARLLGTVVAHFLLIPFAYLVVFIAEW